MRSPTEPAAVHPVPPIPPVGVKLNFDLERRSSGIKARVRWTDPATKRRVTRSEVVPDEEAAEAFLAGLRSSSEAGMDKGITLADYVGAIGDRWARGIDATSTGDSYRYGLRLRVIPSLGHLPVASITAGMIDRTIDAWETLYGKSTIKNSVAPLVRVLDEAARDGLITMNPARNRARRRHKKDALDLTEHDASPRQHAIQDLPTLNALAEACAAVHQSYSDFVMLAALLALRSSEVAGLQVGDIDLRRAIVHVQRQTYPGAGGLVTKRTKGRRTRPVPNLDPLIPDLKRLTTGRGPDERLVTGPRGGVLTTATVRDATDWDALVSRLGLPELTRHGLRHTGATWMADSGIPLHVLQEILGHASIETTRGYLHPDERHLASAAKQASAFLATGAGQRRPQPGRRSGLPLS